MNRIERGLGAGGDVVPPGNFNRRGRRRTDWHQDFDDRPEEPEFDLSGLLRLFWRRKWTIFVITALGLSLGWLYVSQVERQYSATAAVVVDPRQSDALGLQTTLNTTFGTYSIVSTEIQVVRSTSVLLRAAEALNIPSSPVFDERPSRFDTLLNAVGLKALEEPVANNDPDWASLTEAERMEWAGRLGAYLRVEGGGDYTSVILISVTTPVPSESAAWANAVAQAYIDEQIFAKLQAQNQTTTFYQERVTALAADVENIEAQIDAMVFDAIERAGTPIARATLADLRNELGVLEDERGLLDNITTLQRQGDFTLLAAAVDEEAAAEREALVATLATTTDAERAAQIQADLNALEGEIRQAALARADALQTRIAQTEDTVADLQTQLNFQVANQTLPNDVMVDVFELQQDAETTRDLYTTYLTRLRESEQEGALALPDSRIISNAAVPGAPSYPSVRSTLMMALMLAGALGLGLAYIREHVVGGIASPEQMENVLSLPVISVVPKAKGKAEPSSVMISEPMSRFSEAIRRARLALETSGDGAALSVLVTSAVPGDGKTTVALSLARSFAQSGKSTILIDADLRRPSLYDLVDGVDDVELTDYLEYDSSSESMAIREAATGLYLLLREDPREEGSDRMLLSDRFRNVVEYARRNFDVVVFDTSPAGLVIDASIIAREYADAALFVVRADGTPQRPARSAVQELRMHSDIPIVGLLNQVSEGSRRYGKYDGYYYRQPKRKAREYVY